MSMYRILNTVGTLTFGNVYSQFHDVSWLRFARPTRNLYKGDMSRKAKKRSACRIVSLGQCNYGLLVEAELCIQTFK